MKFLAMLLAVLVHWRDRPPPLAWPARWIPVATAAPEWSRLLTRVAVPAAVAGLLLWLLGGWLWGLLGFLIQLLVLVGCLGGTPWRALLDNLVADGYRGDQQAALHSLDELGVEGAATAVADVDELRAATGEVLAMRFLREWFAVLFWFALLGAPGALLYRCLERVAAATGSGTCPLAWLEWPALRAFGLAVAVSGRPGRALGPWAASLGSSERPARVAGGYVEHALDELPADLDPGIALATRVRAMEALFRRAVLAWLVLVALVWIAW